MRTDLLQRGGKRPDAPGGGQFGVDHEAGIERRARDLELVDRHAREQTTRRRGAEVERLAVFENKAGAVNRYVAVGVDRNVGSAEGRPLGAAHEQRHGAAGVDGELAVGDLEANVLDREPQQAGPLDGGKRRIAGEIDQDRPVRVQRDGHAHWMIEERQQELAGEAPRDQ